jgi:hypothetical protein
MRRLALLLGALVLCAACSEPPQKELDRAQGAIDAARAAGAERYATPEFSAATGALKEAARARGDVERTITSVTTSLQQLQVTIKGDAPRLPAPLLADAKRDAATAQAALQKARTLLTAEQYLDARDALAGVEERIAGQLKATADAKARPARRRGA